MISTKNPKIKYLVDATIKKSGPDYTSGLSDLGNGRMEQGLINLWADGESNGITKGSVRTSMVIGACIGGCILIQKAIHKHRVKQAIVEMAKDNELDSTPIASESIDTTDAQNEQANINNEHPAE